MQSPVSGRWIAPDAEQLIGAYVKRGDQIGLIASVEDLLIRAVADQRLGPRIEPEIGTGARVAIRVRGRPDLSLHGTIREVLPSGFLELPSAALGYGAGGLTQVASDDEEGTKTTEPFFEIRGGVNGGVDTLRNHTVRSINCAFARTSQIVGLNGWIGSRSSAGWPR